MTVDVVPLEFGSGRGLDSIPPLVVGAGVFNYQYNDDPHNLPVEQVLRRAFDLGVRAIDTSSYYGPSEQLVGDALSKLKEDYPRDSYFICTKAGRNGIADFGYKSDQIRASVLRSLDRLHTEYIDVLYIHDVEFVNIEGCLEAVSEAFKLKQEGLVRFVGISGYPVAFLFKLATIVLQKLGQPLDTVLSYSNFCIQNTILDKYASRFVREAKLGKVTNASPLNMSLLRSQPTMAFHPAPQILKDKVLEAAQHTSTMHQTELADLAIRFALRNWTGGSTVLGMSNVQEVEQAVVQYWQAQDPQVAASDELIVNEVRHILGETLDMTWPSGIPHDQDQ